GWPCVGQPDRIPLGSFATERAPDGVEYAVDETHRLVSAEAATEFEGFVDHDLGWCLPFVEKLVHAEPKDQAVHHVHPLDAPVVGGFDAERIELRGGLSLG